ncbi:hypothetical protein RMSM_01863, partial [Rhodopirellula maiorica SM1]
MPLIAVAKVAETFGRTSKPETLCEFRYEMLHSVAFRHLRFMCAESLAALAFAGLAPKAIDFGNHRG